MTPRQKLLNAIKENPELVERLLVVAEPAPPDYVRDSDSGYAAVRGLLEGHAEERLVCVAASSQPRC